VLSAILPDGLARHLAPLPLVLWVRCSFFHWRFSRIIAAGDASTKVTVVCQGSLVQFNLLTLIITLIA
jgi:hypothetical protein